MAQHGLLPDCFAELSPAPRRVPVFGVCTMAGLVAILAATLQMEVLLGVTSLACLVVFNLVASGLLMYSCDTDNGRHQCIIALPTFCALAIAQGFQFFNHSPLVVVVPTGLALIMCAVAVMTVKYSPREATLIIPGGAAIPLFAILCNSYMVAAMGSELCVQFLCWVVPGVVVYALYGQHNSRLNGPSENTGLTRGRSANSSI